MTSQVISLPGPMPEVLAVGAFLKNTLAAIKGDRAYLSASVGNLESPEAIAAFEQAATELVATHDLKPVLIAHDLHPDFYSTRWAAVQSPPVLAVQHHHAHIAAVAAEHGWTGPLVGLALDGFGLGPGNQSWGGELLLVDGAFYRRLGHLACLAQPGGDIVARQPWRMAAAALHRLGRGTEIAGRFAMLRGSDMLERIIERGLNCPETSSAGRLFDAACGLLGVHPVAQFEGQAPMALEGLVTAPKILAGGWRIENGILDCLPLLEALIGQEAAPGADLFHGTLAAALVDWAARAAEEAGVNAVAMGGGCFLNRVLSRSVAEGLAGRGLTAMLSRVVSPGDPGISLGQAWIAALSAERRR